MQPELLEQGSPEWHAARCGSVGASGIETVLAKGRNGGGSVTRRKLLVAKVAERLTGQAEEGYTNAAMQWGTETEPQARAAYSFEADVEVETCGLYRHPTIPHSHASPDGLVGSDGLVEIKCPNSTTHVATLLGDPIPTGYILQMQWQMACTGRTWCDFVSFDPRMPGDLQIHIARIERDDVRIAEIAAAVKQFNAEVDSLIHQLRSAA